MKDSDKKVIGAILETIGNNVKRFRGKISQTELAEKAEIGRSTLSAIENGKSIELDNLLRVARGLDIDPVDLFLTEEEIKSLSYKGQILLDKLSKLIFTEDNLEKRYVKEGKKGGKK
jgi:transcriptional regulator with XRE-family HTH domain